jgi:hypothetical protein
MSVVKELNDRVAQQNELARMLGDDPVGLVGELVGPQLAAFRKQLMDEILGPQVINELKQLREQVQPLVHQTAAQQFVNENADIFLTTGADGTQQYTAAVDEFSRQEQALLRRGIDPATAREIALDTTRTLVNFAREALNQGQPQQQAAPAQQQAAPVQRPAVQPPAKKPRFIDSMLNRPRERGSDAGAFAPRNGFKPTWDDVDEYSRSN